MNAETPNNALRYLLQDDIYLLNSDKEHYRNPEVQPAAPQPVSQQPVVEETPALLFKYLGGNNKNFLVLSYYPNEEFIAGLHLKALESTINRLSLMLEDIAIVNKATYPDASIEQLATYFSPQKLLILGKDAIPAGLPVLQINAIQTINDYQALYTFSFDEMMGNKENTKIFWNQIKAI